MAGMGSGTLLSFSSKSLVSLAARNGAECLGRSRAGGALDVLFRKNCDLSRGLGAALHLTSTSGDVCDKSLARTRAGGLAGAGVDRLRNLAPKAAVQKEVEKEEVSVSSQGSRLKEFLEDLKSIGRARLIVNTGVAVLESVTSFDKLFYHEMPGRGEYANLMLRDENVDFHLLLQKVKVAELKRGKSMRGDIPTYMVKFVDTDDKPAVSVLVMWKPGTDGEYDPGQVEAFEALEAKYGTEVQFLV